MTIMFALQYQSVAWAWGGNHPATRTMEDVQHRSMVATIAIPFWAWSTGLVKISIACMLLRFSQSVPWRTIIYFMIVLNCLLVIFTGVVNFFQCIPYQALWDFKNEIKNKRCWDRDANMAVAYVSAVCNVSTDVVFSLIPLTFLGKIRRPLREKVVIGGLMALGLVASAFSLSKAIVTARMSKGDLTANVTLFGLLTCLEVQTSFIAACIPTLRSLSKRFLQRVGLINSTRGSEEPRYGAGSSISGGPKRERRPQMEHPYPHGHSGGMHSTPSIEIRDSEEAQYEQDPVTGRIICRTVSEINRSGSTLNDQLSGKKEATMIDEEDQYVQDPVTGRIMCRTELKLEHSGSTLNDEWHKGKGVIVKEKEKEDSDEGIGIAR